MEKEIEKWEKCGESKERTYFVSNLGRVKSVTKVNKIEKILKGIPDKKGYLRIKVGTIKFIHYLVALAFLGEKPEGLQTDHIDRNKLNNRSDNLRYCTQSENMRNRDDYRSDILETDRKERAKIFDKEYREKNYEANKEAILEKKKEKYTCDCGSTLRKSDKIRHERNTKKHQNWLANNP